MENIYYFIDESGSNKEKIILQADHNGYRLAH